VSINWKVARRVCYLIEVGYTKADESAATAYWCGPPALTGSGLAVPRPTTSTIVAYEGRVRSLDISESMQRLPAIDPRMGSLSLSVQAPIGEELHKQGRTATWTGGTVRAWWYDLDTGDYEGAWEGKVSGEPDWTADGLAFRAEWVIGALGSPIVCTRLLSAANWTKTTDYSGVGDLTWNPPSAANKSGPIYPNRYGLHPDLRGKLLAPTWGQGADGWTYERTGRTAPADPLPGSWVECVIYGQKAYGGSPVTGPYYWIHVCPQIGVFVWDVLIDSVSKPFSGGQSLQLPYLASDDTTAEILTGYNDDPTAGPVGTFVRLYRGLITIGGVPTSSITASWDGTNPNPRSRVYCLVTGINSAGTGGANYDPNDNPFLNTDLGDGGNGTDPLEHGGLGFGPDDPLTARDRLDQILEDVVTDSDIITDADSLYTGEPAAWWAARPSAFSTDALTKRIGALLPVMGDEEPTGVAVLAGVIGIAGASLVRRWDATADRIRWLPVWLGPQSGDTADVVLLSGHLQRPSPPSAAGGAGEVFSILQIKWPELISQQYDGDGGGVSGSGGIPAFVERVYAPSWFETDFGAQAVVGPRRANATVRYLHPFDPTPGATEGYESVAEDLLSLMTGKVPIVRAELGMQVAMRCPLGSLVRFDVDGLPAEVGQVRSWRVSSSGRASIEVWYQSR